MVSLLAALMVLLLWGVCLSAFKRGRPERAVACVRGALGGYSPLVAGPANLAAIHLLGCTEDGFWK